MFQISNQIDSKILYKITWIWMNGWVFLLYLRDKEWLLFIILSYYIVEPIKMNMHFHNFEYRYQQ